MHVFSALSGYVYLPLVLSLLVSVVCPQKEKGWNSLSSYRYPIHGVVKKDHCHLKASVSAKKSHYCIIRASSLVQIHILLTSLIGTRHGFK